MLRSTMRKLILTEFLTLDGVMEDPTWTGPYWCDDIARFKYEELMACDTLLYGRVTYQIMAEAWPTEVHKAAMLGMFTSLPDPGAFSAAMNGIQKYVVSETLAEVSWQNSTLIRGDIIEEVTKLKQQPGKNILILGSGVLARHLLEHRLIDEMHLLVYPVHLGSGVRLFGEGQHSRYELLETKPVGPNVVHLAYHLAEP